MILLCALRGVKARVRFFALLKTQWGGNQYVVGDTAIAFLQFHVGAAWIRIGRALAARGAVTARDSYSNDRKNDLL